MEVVQIIRNVCGRTRLARGYEKTAGGVRACTYGFSSASGDKDHRDIGPKRFTARGRVRARDSVREI